jgi:pyrroloquinoline quinone biosynthesis protein B
MASIREFTICVLLTCIFICFSSVDQISSDEAVSPYLVVLGIAQDGGVPQAGDRTHKGWNDASFKRHASCLAIVDPAASKRWMIDCTPDFREQLHMLDEIAPIERKPGLDGIMLSHAHIGHYTGLMHLGLEVMGAREVPVYAMPRMQKFLEENGPWSQLVNYRNILLQPMQDGVEVSLTTGLSIEPFLVPHRQEYSEVVGFFIKGPKRTVLYISDIDSWEEWEEMGTRIGDLIPLVDVAYLDGTFYANGEIPGRDMSSFPHPFITHSMDTFDKLSAEDRGKIRFIHLNHTNPALLEESEARRTIEENGFHVAEELERIGL